MSSKEKIINIGITGNEIILNRYFLYPDHKIYQIHIKFCYMRDLSSQVLLITLKYSIPPKKVRNWLINISI